MINNVQARKSITYIGSMFVSLTNSTFLKIIQFHYFINHKNVVCY